MNSAALTRLLAWLSPSYPVGAFSYSHGLEWLVETGDIHNCASMVDWISDLMRHGSGRNDAILFACAHRTAQAGEPEKLAAINEQACAYSASAERHLETTAQGTAFSDVTRKTWSAPSLDALSSTAGHAIAYPVAVGAASADHGIALVPALEAYLHAMAANLVSAGLRLVPLGHTDGQRALIALEPVLTMHADEQKHATLDDLGGLAFTAEMAAMFHETQYTRLFRS